MAIFQDCTSISQSRHIHHPSSTFPTMVNTKPVNIILGTANFGEEKGSWWNESDSHVLQAFSLLQKYGHNKLDSAQAYLGSEARLGSLQAGTRHNLSIDTKWRGGWAQEPNANSADNILATAKDSIQKLGVSSVDIFYIHAPIYNHPLEDTLSGVDAAHKAGLFKHFGLSNFPSADVQKVYDICRQENFVLPSVYQGNYSAVARAQETELLPLLRKLNMSFYAYSPIAGGFLTKTREQIEGGKTRFSPDQMYGLYHRMYVKDKFMSALEAWAGIAEDEGVSRAELAYRWIVYSSSLRPEFGDGIVVGASNAGQLEQTLEACARGPLSEGTVRRIEGIWEMVKEDAIVDNYQAVFGGKN
jgi:aflatoxin B1 aldehyde reductase